MEQDRQKSELNMILRCADLRGKRVLEVGCGDGRLTAMLASGAGHLVAIDPDTERLETAKANVQGVDFRQGSGESLNFPDESFDIVAFTFSLHHHQDIARALEETHRVLRPDGQALAIEPSVEGEMHRFFRAFRDEDDRLAAAQVALRNCRLAIKSSETFSIEWIFDDNEDVYDYFFTQNRMPRDPECIGKMDRLLGDKKMQRPIILSEAVLAFSLVKK